MASRTPLPDGAIAGIAVGAAFGVVVTAIALVYGLYHHRRRSRRGRTKDVEKQHRRRVPESVGSAAGLVTAKSITGKSLEEGDGSGGGGRGSGRTGKPTNMTSTNNVGLRPDQRAEREERSRERERAKDRSLSAMGRRNTG